MRYASPILIVCLSASVSGCAVVVSPQRPAGQPTPQSWTTTARTSASPPTLDSASNAPGGSAQTLPPVQTAEASQAPAPGRPTETQQRDQPSAPIRLSGLRYGQTARLRYFDITVQRFEHGKDGISAGWRTQTCYTHPHPQAESGRVRVSTGPWQAYARDGEGGGTATHQPVDSIGIDPTWSPLYVTRQLALGECQTGWISIRHNNPDLQWLGIRYAPADGDIADWS